MCCLDLTKYEVLSSSGHFVVKENAVSFFAYKHWVIYEYIWPASISYFFPPWQLDCAKNQGQNKNKQ